MTNPKRARAGWYPDPMGQARLRWWDNHTWTTHISDSDAATIAPAETRSTSTPAGCRRATACTIPARPSGAMINVRNAATNGPTTVRWDDLQVTTVTP